MSEFIDRNKLLKTINENVAEAHNERCSQLLEAILNAPTADVVEVRHGEWVYVDGDVARLYTQIKSEIKADTVKKMHSMLCEGRVSNDNVVIVANQIAKEMLEGEK